MLAINRRQIVERVTEGVTVPATQLVPTGMTGFDPSIALPEQDPAKARALLATAGYPNGFKLTIHTTVGRYPNDQQQAEAVAQMLARIGIQTDVASLPVAIFFVQARKHAFSFKLVSWGFSTGDMEPDPELTQVGPGTPCGEYLRRFWHPIALASMVTELPLRVRRLGEDLILFRDGSGAYGLLHLYCAHRNTSLEFGIIEETGIRCCYHGWLFAPDGTIL